MSKELNDVKKALQKWLDKHEGTGAFIFSCHAFDYKKNDLVDDMVCAIGSKELLMLDVTEIKKMIKEDKDEFINW